MPFDGWGNMLLQYCFARSLGLELNYQVKCRKLPFLPNSGDFNEMGSSIDSPVLDITHTSNWRHRVDFDDIKRFTDCMINVKSYLEYYPNIEKHRDAIRDDWVYIENKLPGYFSDSNTEPRGGFTKYINGEFKRISITSINRNDLVLSIRLGKDYLGQHRYRLLESDYFKILLDSLTYERLFITSQDPHHPILSDLYKYDPIFLDHITPIHTLNFVRLFNKIALSQSTFSWWAAYLSDAEEIYFPITKDGPWSYGPNQNQKWKKFGHDLMVNEPRYQYVSYQERLVLGDYKTTRDHLQL